MKIFTHFAFAIPTALLLAGAPCAFSQQSSDTSEPSPPPITSAPTQYAPDGAGQFQSGPLAAPTQSPAPTPSPTPSIEAAARSGKHSSSVSEEQAMQWFNMLDTNHDGCISRQEAALVIMLSPKVAKWFEAADFRGTGCITPEDIRTVAARTRAEREAKRAREAAKKAAQTASQPTAQSDTMPQP